MDRRNNINKIMQTIQKRKDFLPTIENQITYYNRERADLEKLLENVHTNVTAVITSGLPYTGEVVEAGVQLLNDVEGALHTVSYNLDALQQYFTEVDNSIELQGRSYPEVILNDRVDNLSIPVIVPRAHLDKSVLTEQEARELVSLILEKPEILQIDNVLNTYVRGYPESTAAKVIDFLGRTIYGENNYIGPTKMGMLPGEQKVIDILTLVPALSKEDAEARAHDVFLTAQNLYHNNNKDPHDILSDPLMRYAQVAAPLFSEPVPDKIEVIHNPTTESGTASNSNLLTRMMICLLLLISGIEWNPGWSVEWDEMSTYVDKIMKIMSNPVDASSYLNTMSGSADIMEMEYQARKGQYDLKSALDDTLDSIQLRSNWVMLAGQSLDDIAAPNWRHSQMSQRYSLWNKTVKSVLPLATLGEDLKKSSVEFSPFLALERTHTNMLDGDANLAAFVRTPNVDYGVYANLTKLLIYESRHCQLVGDEAVGYTVDSVSLADPNVAYYASSGMFPRTTNLPLSAIDAYAVKCTDFASMLRGVIPFPAGVSGYDSSTAWIMGADTLSPQVRSYAVICHLEFPFADSGLRRKRRSPVAEYASNSTAGPISDQVLIDGPKDRVIFIMATNLNSVSIDIDDGVGGTLPIPVYNPAAPAAVNIGPALFAYFDNKIDHQAVESPDWRDTFEYLLRFMDLADWYSSLILASAILQWKAPYESYPVYVGGDTGNNRPWYASANGVPNVDVSFPLTDTNPWVVGTSTTNMDAHGQKTKFNCFGMPTTWVGAHVPPGGGAAYQIQPTAYIQEASPLTRYGIFTKYYAKDTLTGTAVASITKVPGRKLFYVVRELGDIFVEMTSKFYERSGIRLSVMMDHAIARQTYIRQQAIDKLKAMEDAGLETLCGFNPISMNKQWPDYGLNIQTSGNFNRTYYMNSMIVLFNHYETKDRDGPKWEYYGLDFRPKTLPNNYVPKGLSEVLGISNAPVVNVRGTNVQNTAKIVIQVHDWYDNTGLVAQWARNFWAIMKTTHFLNAGGYAFLVYTYLNGEGRNDYQNPGIPYMMCNEWLYYNSAAVPARSFITAKQGMIITALHSPPNFDDINGCKLSAAFGSEVEMYNVRPCLTLKGVGSVRMTYTSNVSAPAANYFSTGYKGATVKVAVATIKSPPPGGSGPNKKDDQSNPLQKENQVIMGANDSLVAKNIANNAANSSNLATPNNSSGKE